MKKNLNLFCLVLMSLLFSSCTNKDQLADKKSDTDVYKHWLWTYTDEKDTNEELAIRYKKYKDAGVVGIFFGNDSERHYRAAKAQGLEAHRWMWIMNRGDALEKHPEWGAMSRTGKSCSDHPPYVDYYRWMCPSRPEVAKFLVDDVKNTLSKDYVDGIHMDYVRYSDVVLAVNLWQVYGIEQKEELPEYDFCYCDVCKTQFTEKYHRNIDEVQYPQEDLSWRTFRYDAVTNIVNQIAEVAVNNNKPLTAAVFPTPDVAKRLVRQDWTSWPLDAVYPMIYHGFYKEEVPWIGDAVKQGLKGIGGKYPLYAGLYMPDFKNKQEVEEGVRYALDNGAKGIAIFGDVDDEILAILTKYKAKKE